MKRALARFLFIAASFAAALFIGESYIQRLPDHRGFFLVPVNDELKAPLPDRPARTVVIVLDGLRADFARKMRALRLLEERGQCRTTDVGPISVSRPVYAVISTGLEQDRTGSRNNDETSPLAAESIWEVAREAGLRVQAAGVLPWWSQLFPRGFDRSSEVLLPIDQFELSLWHLLYIDDRGHEKGAASAEYRAAVERADTEVSALLEQLDLARDLVVVTADHGHSERGGHGGPDPEIRLVQTCFAGRGIPHRAEGSAISSRTIAPALSVLLGLRFPRHMRAGEDDLDAIFTLVDPSAFPAEYLADRKNAVDRFRAENLRVIGRPWSELYASEHRWQVLRGAGFAVLIALALAFSLRRRLLSAQRTIFLLSWIAGLATLAVALHVFWLGSFDWTAINERTRYLEATVILCVGVSLFGVALHGLLIRDLHKLADDQLTFLALSLALSAGVPIAFGWRLGFPLPGPVWLLYPFFGSIALASQALRYPNW